ncbi:hypothetical protein TrRE_jg6823 [Triparma retinervis]|uniref:Uncharacterized protein n=1 Tax=Triparma retinervis TaxID=2557542 RepID=A0A9W7DK01_9STRA|nr:hypothetical protein TrRE_jg6823 [Triparma retinervis]
MSSVSVGNIDSKKENERVIIGPEINSPSKKNEKLRIGLNGFGVKDCARRSPIVPMKDADTDFVIRG